MKKIIKNILLIMLAVTAVVCSALGLAACADDNLLSISVVDAKVEFRVGDEFEYGEYFTVYANYKDGTRENVTDEVQIRKENGFDMNVAGNYQITVSYGGRKEVYTIYVGAFDNVLRKLEVEGAKTDFKLGESFSYEGLKLTATYENAQGDLINNVYTSLREFTVEITDENGNKVDEVFPKFGNYTVTISRGNVKVSYSVSVADVDISTVQGAIAVGTAFQSEVLSGTMKYSSGLYGENLVTAADYEYKFGDNYTYYIEKSNIPNNSFHMSMDDEGFFYVQLQDGKIVSNSNAQSSMMGGAPIQLWYYNSTEYGIENALNNLYKHAVQATNDDLEETVNEAERSYSFSFSGLERRGALFDYYETQVIFTLSESYNLERVQVEQSYWENDSKKIDDKTDEMTPPTTFKTDEETNITSPLKRYSYKIGLTCNQTTGKRTEVNPYNRDMFKITSYDLKYNGQTLDENAVINCDMTKTKLSIDIVDILPETADFALDPIYMNYEGSNRADSEIDVACEGFYAYRSGNSISVTLYNGGVWKLILKTKFTTKTITFDVIGVAPDKMTAQVRNEATKAFYTSATKIMALNGETYFYGAVDKYKNSAQSAEIISANAQSGKIEQVTLDGLKCFKFTATEMGEYKVKVTSDVNPKATATFTFTVSDVPDYAALLSGKYTVTDLLENVYELAFTPAGTGDEVKGTVKVTKTPTNENDGTLITAEMKTETLTFTVDFENFVINLTHNSGDNLGIALAVNASGALTLEDQYGDVYELTPVA